MKKLVLRNNGLYGALPSSISLLPNLTSVTIAEDIDMAALGTVTTLQNVNLFSLAGNPNLLPPDVSFWSDHLTSLTIECTNCRQSFPIGFGALRSLKNLTITGFIGNFPSEIWNLTSLETLNLNAPFLRGTINPNIKNLKQLKTLSLLDTFQGTMPNEIVELSSLESLEVFSPLGFQMHIDDRLSSLTSLKRLYLQGLSISGTLPESISNCRELLKVEISGTNIVAPLPSSLSTLPRLEVFVIAESGPIGIIPEAWSHFESIQMLSITNSGLTGTLPSPWYLPNATIIRLSHNSITGTIPSMQTNAARLNFAIRGNLLNGTLQPLVPLATIFEEVAVGFNQLEGSIPSELLHHVPFLKLQNNKLSGSLDFDVFRLSNVNLLWDFSSNLLSGELPDTSGPMSCSGTRIWFSLQLGNNSFTGNLSCMYFCASDLLDISSNNFNDSCLFHSNVLYVPEQTVLSHNNFAQISAIPVPVLVNARVWSLDLSNNYFSGNLPQCSPALGVRYSLSLNNNNFSASLSPLFNCDVVELDVSSNQLTGDFDVLTFGKELQLLNLANNRFFGKFALSSFSITYLDISSNLFDMVVWPHGQTYSPLQSIIVSNNPRLLSWLEIPRFSDAAFIDISNTSVPFVVSDIPNLFPKALSLKFRGCGLKGVLALPNLPLLKLADFSDNVLWGVNFEQLESVVLKGLGSLYIHGNPELPRIPIQSVPQLATVRGSSIPSILHPHLDCNAVVFAKSHATIFTYDEYLFNYTQCHCADRFFGFSTTCRSCPPDAICSAGNMTVPPNYYAFYANPADTDTLLPTIHIESCVPFPTSSVTSSCLGFTIDSPYQLKDINQCSYGSSGRMCSRCLCENATSCFRQSSNSCKSCSLVFTTSQTVGIMFGVLFIATLIQSIVFFFVISSSRRYPSRPFEKLKFLKRLIERLRLFVSSGYIRILIAFGQVFVGVVQRDLELVRWILQITNWTPSENSNTHLSLLDWACWPWTSQPLPSLLVSLFIPILCILTVAASVTLAEIETKLLQSAKPRSDVKTRPYPAIALFSSASITIITFFYFPMAVASTQYFFWSQQDNSDFYVSTTPWMSYDSAHLLRMVSLPILLLYVCGVPVVFACMSWILRHKVFSPKIKDFVGTVYSRYVPKFFWWELVIVLRNLVIALLLRGVSQRYALQPLFIAVSLISILIAQQVCLPWKRRTENICDMIASLLLVLSMVTSGMQALTGSIVASFFVAALDLVFVLLLVGLALYTALTEKPDYVIQWEILSSDPSHKLIGSTSEAESADENWLEIETTPLLGSPSTNTHSFRRENEDTNCVDLLSPSMSEEEQVGPSGGHEILS